MSATAAAAAPVPQNGFAPLLIRRAAVLGAGAMGSRIAAHLANAGISTLLLDLPAADRSIPAPAFAAVQALAQARPAPLYAPSLVQLITPGVFDEDLPRLADCDWVVEAVAENLDIKTALLARAVPYLASRAILTTNTSGLPIARLAAAIPSVRGRFFGAHFFNPPRQMRLVEIIPTPHSDPALVAAFSAFADRLLGKQVVLARDTPNFIANRIGIAAIFSAANLMLDLGLSIEEVDALTGPAIGWPRSGTFRLADLIGVDILAHIAANFPGGVSGGGFSALLGRMIARGWLGDKAGQGFYRKVRGANGGDDRLVLDPATCDYRPAVQPVLPALESAKSAAALPERLRLLLAGSPAADKAAAFLWPFLASLWNHAAECIGEVAADAPSIDAAMRNGFNWELGPFELWDAAGVAETAERMRALGLPVAAATQSLLAAGRASWYQPDGRACFQPATGQNVAIPTMPGHARVADFRRARAVVQAGAGASLVDLGDGIACIELHSFKNAVGEDVLAFISSVLDPASEAVRAFSAFVVSGDRENFSVGANLMQILRAAQMGNWDELTGVIRHFQRMTAAIKFCPRPVVAAPFGLTLGGGAEICLHAAGRQPHAELYMGLVEAGVGLIPAGGGTKEMLLRACDAAAALVPPAPGDPPSRFAQSGALLAALTRAHRLIAAAKTSASAAEARSMGLLTPCDRITMNRERLLLDAKAQAAVLAGAGYMPPQPRAAIPAPGQDALAALESGIDCMGEAGRVSEHDRKVARWAANILAAGRIPPGTLVSEEDILGIELEAFLSLCGEPKTQERIAFTLKTGKPLRN